MRDQRTSPATTAQRLVADTANALRARLRKSRQYVSPRLNDYAGRRRGRATAEGLALLTATMIEAGDTEAEVASLFALLGARLYAEHTRGKAS